jgi:hypothetical protein
MRISFFLIFSFLFIGNKKKSGKLKHDKYQSVSRIGHTLHKLEPEFKQVAFSDKVKVK